jgi:hypothetical protein
MQRLSSRSTYFFKRVFRASWFAAGPTGGINAWRQRSLA